MASKATDRKTETDTNDQDKSATTGGQAAATAKSGGEDNDSQSGKNQSPSIQSPAAKSASGGSKDAAELIKEDHRRVEKLFQQFEQSRNFNQKIRLVEQICIELNTHTLIEEQIFYPACRGKVEDDLLDEAQVEHDGAKQLIIELQGGSPVDQYYEAKVKVLSEYIKHHVAEEERPGDGILDAARKAGVDLMALGREIEEQRPELQQQAIDDPEPDMPSRDDDGGQPYRRAPQRGRGGQGASRGQSGGRSGSGWHGDPEGHSQAARRGAEHRGDDGRYASQSRGSSGRYQQDDRGGGDRGSGRSGQGGWFGDPEGHSEAARRGAQHRGSHEDDDRGYSRTQRDGEQGRGQGGWFGDPEGHARAGRHSHDHDDDRSYASSNSGGRYEDDDRGGRGGGRYR